MNHGGYNCEADRLAASKRAWEKKHPLRVLLGKTFCRVVGHSYWWWSVGIMNGKLYSRVWTSSLCQTCQNHVGGIQFKN